MVFLANSTYVELIRASDVCDKLKNMIFRFASAFLPLFFYNTAHAAIVACNENPTECGWKELIETVNNMFDTVLWLILPLLAILFVVGGIMLYRAGYTGDKNGYKKVLKLFTRMGIGIILVILAYIIIKTFVTALGVDSDIIDKSLGNN